MTEQVYDDLYNSDVYALEDEKVGAVGQVYLDDKTGDPTWVTVKTGLFGTKETFVPLEGAAIADGKITVPFTAEQVKDAPAVDPDRHLDATTEAELYRYYGFETTVVESDDDTDVDETVVSDADDDGLAADADAAADAEIAPALANQTTLSNQSTQEDAVTDHRDAEHFESIAEDPAVEFVTEDEPVLGDLPAELADPNAAVDQTTSVADDPAVQFMGDAQPVVGGEPEVLVDRVEGTDHDYAATDQGAEAVVTDEDAAVITVPDAGTPIADGEQVVSDGTMPADEAVTTDDPAKNVVADDAELNRVDNADVDRVDGVDEGTAAGFHGEEGEVPAIPVETADLQPVPEPDEAAVAESMDAVDVSDGDPFVATGEVPAVPEAADAVDQSDSNWLADSDER